MTVESPAHETQGKTLVQALAAAMVDAREHGIPAEVRASVRQRILDTLGICVAASGLPTSAAIRRFALAQGGVAEADAVGVAGGPPGCPGGTGQRHPGALARLRRHPSALGPAPQCHGRARLPRRGPAGRHVWTRGDCRHCGRPRGLCAAGHGWLRRAGAQLEYFDRGQHATSICGAIAAAGCSGLAAGPSRRRHRQRHGHRGVAWRAGSSRPTAPAAPSSGSTADGPRTPAISAARTGRVRDHRAADRAGGPVRVLPRLSRWPLRPDGDHRRAWARNGPCRASTSSPIRPTTSPTPAIDAAIALRAAGRRPGTWRRSGSACRARSLHTVGDPIEVKRSPGDRLPGPVQRAIRRRRRRSSAGTASASGSTTSPMSWPATQTGGR